MTEPTNTTNDSTFFDERSESEKSIAADIAMIIESAAKEKTSKAAPIIEVKPLVTKEYVDPQEQEYIILRTNVIGSPDHRMTPEGIGLWHRTFTLMGDQAEY